MQGAGWAPRSLAFGCGVVCVGVPASALGPGTVPLRGKAQQAPWGVLSRAGLAGGGGASRGPGGEAREPSVCVSFWKRRAWGGVWTQGPPESWCRGRISWFPACLALVLWSFAHPALRGEVEPGSGFSGWAALVCISQAAGAVGRAGGQQRRQETVRRIFKTQLFSPASVAAQ